MSRLWKNKKVFFFGCLCIALLLLSPVMIKIIDIKTADTYWIECLGYDEDEVYALKLDRVGCPVIPVTFGEETYDFYFDTGCATGIAVTNVLENKIDYTVLKQIEQLNRDGSHRGWSYGISIKEMKLFDETFQDVACAMTDWKMSSSHKFNGLLGTEFFKGKMITIDYRARKIGVSEENANTIELSEAQYAIVPMLHTETEGHENLVFFECVLNDEKAVAYIDTGKNLSYIHNPDSEYIIGASTEKPNIPCRDAIMNIGKISLELHDMYEANIPQYDDFSYVTAMELNSDQFLEGDIILTLDFINNNVIFMKR